MSSDSKPSQRPAYFLAGLLGAAGVLHFAQPKPFDAIIPKQLPGSPRAWTYGSGVAELGVAAAIAAPKTRRLGGLAAALLFVVVLPGNVKMAVDADRRKAPKHWRAAFWARVPLQIPLVTWALKVRDRA
ncbi:hypothetical protein DL991_03975 [Amycolatopsis sp. WAC 01375]|uniref:DoxX family protein n=1 Tax=unclassified Amycolatopsis TaxID=2618356 RepID=UPI000F7B9026|nr:MULTISPECIES: MauE/DoxX family redox-associated membrane protein [unclassified Amycolatopsis]RSM54421.1 hypothetical protein DMH03_37015 [Amycolatopsis sp. WAC 01376]RSM82999.1 hypothetical protein DL991_03975 [Amycolatopsis sp. WAC 01375]RSN36325.1 hypothetical protein DL990_09415 [Amycolatopsis sp. WAC 01416]